MPTMTEAVDRLEWRQEAVALVGHMASHRADSPEGLAILAGAALMLAHDAGTYGSAATHRAALHSALMSGIRAALGKGLSGDAAVKAAISHADQSVPDAMARLGPSAEVLTSLAQAKLREVLGK